RCKQRVARLDAQVLRVAAQPAETHVEGVEVEHLETPALTRHQRIVLVAEAEVQRQLLVDLPAIRDVDAELVLAAREFLELDALAELAQVAEHHAGKGVPAADAGVAGNAGEAASEAQVAARVADLGLPVVEREAHEVEPRADLVTPRDLGHVDRRGVAALVTPDWRPGGVVAEGAETGVELRHAAVTFRVLGAVAR